MLDSPNVLRGSIALADRFKIEVDFIPLNYNSKIVKLIFTFLLYLIQMSHKPFIIKRKQPLVPQDSDVYDARQQERIHIIQAANGYLAINMFYESFKLLWQFSHYRIECPDFAYLSLGFMLLNIIWGLTSILGFKSINSKNSRKINLFVYTLIVNLILRIIMYIICGIIMKGYAKDYYEIDLKEKNNMICNAIYPSSLYVMQGIFQSLVCLFILVISKGIAVYINKWQNWEIKKMIPNKFNNLSEYN